MQILKAKKQYCCPSFFAHLRSGREKAASRTFMKSTPKADFTHFLRAAFTNADPESEKNTVQPSVLFALLGSSSRIAVGTMLVKSTPVSFAVSSLSFGV